MGLHTLMPPPSPSSEWHYKGHNKMDTTGPDTHSASPPAPAPLPYLARESDCVGRAAERQMRR